MRSAANELCDFSSSSNLLVEVPIRPGGGAGATGIIYHGLNVQSVLAMANVFSEQKVDVPNNVWSERTFVRVFFSTTKVNWPNFHFLRLQYELSGNFAKLTVFQYFLWKDDLL